MDNKKQSQNKVKVAFAVELPATLLKEILRWLLFGMALSQHSCVNH
jgi:hypothetical protein